MSEIDELLTEVRVEASTRRHRGRRVLLLLAGIATIAAVTAGTVLALSATTSVAAFESKASEPQRDDQADDEPFAVHTATPGPSDSTSAGEGAETDIVGPATSASDYEPTQPVVGPDGLRYDQWGARLYDVTTDLSTIEYPAEMSEEERVRAASSFAQQQIVAQCMHEKGYDLWFKAWWEISPDDRGVAQYPIGTPGFEAEYGPEDQPSGEDYDWQQAGCVGYAVHVTGNDENN